MALDQITVDSGTPRVVYRARGGASGRLTALQVQIISTAGDGALQFRKRLHDSGVADASAPLAAYEDETAGSVVDGETPAAEVRLYRIPSDNCDVVVELASGTSVTFCTNQLTEN